VSYVEIPPFTEVVWLSEDARERYEEAISRFERIYHKVELMSVVLGMRRCDVEHINPETMQQQLVLLHQAGLKFKALDLVKRYSGFAHKHERPVGLQDSMVFGVVGLDEEDLEIFAKAYYSGDHDTQGRLLGYPECCRRFFSRVWAQGHLDPIVEIAKSTGMSEEGVVRGDPLLNIMLRYAGVRVIPFMPCSFRCQNARMFALQFLRLLEREDPESTRLALELLSKPLRWSQVNGIIQVEVGDVMIIIAGGYTSERQEVKFIPEYDATTLVRGGGA